MSLLDQSFLSTRQLGKEDVELIFKRAQLFKSEFLKHKRFDHLAQSDGAQQKVLAMVFFEPSTRTRMSFQVAAFRLGVRVTSLDSLSISSVSKGETLSDTLMNVGAMQPDVLAVRYGTSKEIDECLKEMPCPVVNAGSGTDEHPTQALLDAFTIKEARGKLEGEKVLIVGDVLHSRVANSNLTLLRELGAEVAFCAPEEFIPQNEHWKNVQHFSELEEGMKWATVTMGLRIQKERHSTKGVGLTVAEYREKYRIGADQLKVFNPEGVLLHPGPVIRGVEISSYALKDPRCRVLEQVKNGVFIRAALLSLILGLEVHNS